MSTAVFYFLIVPLAIGSCWIFGAMMRTWGKRWIWNPRPTFWSSAGLYGIVGFVIPLILLETGYDSFYFYWIFTFIGLSLVWIVIIGIFNRKEMERVRSIGLEKKEDPSTPEPSRSPKIKKSAQAPARSVRATNEPMKRAEENRVLATGTVHLFVSYRRSDSADISGRIYDRLVGRFGREAVFKDVDSIPLGIDFKEYLDQQVSECDVLLAVIGDRWLEASGAAGKKRLDDPADFVRIEIESALERNIPVIPLLVREAKMPGEESLPPSLRKLVYRNGIPIRSDPDFHRDMDRLIAGLEKYVR